MLVISVGFLGIREFDLTTPIRPKNGFSGDAYDDGMDDLIVYLFVIGRASEIRTHDLRLERAVS